MTHLHDLDKFDEQPLPVPRIVLPEDLCGTPVGHIVEVFREGGQVGG